MSGADNGEGHVKASRLCHTAGIHDCHDLEGGRRRSNEPYRAELSDQPSRHRC